MDSDFFDQYDIKMMEGIQMDMKDQKAAILCYVKDDSDIPGLGEQRQMLEQYILDHGMTLENCYFVSGYEKLTPSNPVFKMLLRDTARESFDILLVRNFDQILLCNETQMPRLRVFSLEDQEMREIGSQEQSSEYLDSVPTIDHVSVYWRQGKQQEDTFAPQIGQSM